MTAYEEILEYLNGIKVINTHEHFNTEEHRLAGNHDIFTLLFFQYGSTDLISAGLPKENLKTVREFGFDLEKKWELLAPYWEDVQNTSYFVAVNRMCKELYGIDRLDGTTYKRINEAMKATEKKGLFKDILQNKCNYVTSINDQYYKGAFEVDQELITPMLHSCCYVLVAGYMGENLHEIAAKYDCKIENLDDWTKLIFKGIKYDTVRYKAAAMKISLAYDRSLKFTDPDKSDVEHIFAEVVKDKKVSESDYLLLQDYLMHRVLEASLENDLTIQVHTGIQEGNGNHLAQANPLLIDNLIMQYPDIRWDILHSSYPYDGEAGVLAKMFPNVRINMAWTHIISREFAVSALIKWLDFLPVNKIFAFGGDVLYPEYSYPGLLIAKENVAKALAHHVDNGNVTIEWAKTAGRKMFFDNPNNFYKLGY